MGISFEYLDSSGLCTLCEAIEFKGCRIATLELEFSEIFRNENATEIIGNSIDDSSSFRIITECLEEVEQKYPTTCSFSAGHNFSACARQINFRVH